MDVWEARAELGVADTDGWEVIRAAYRRRIRVVHPDVAGAEAGTARTAARLNEAYMVLGRAKRAGDLDGPRQSPDGAAPARRPAPTPAPPTASGGAPPVAPSPPAMGVSVAGADTLLLAVPPDEAFARLLEAGHRVGAVTYVDRSCAIFEVVVDVDGESCSLVVTLQGRAHGTEALLTLESLERPFSHSPESILRQMVAALR